MSFFITIKSVSAHPHGCDGPEIPDTNPIDAEIYSEIFIDDYTARNGTAGRLYMPKENGNFVDDLPLVIILHAQLFKHDEYDYLQEHLASNGIASASISFTDATIETEIFEDSFQSHLEFLYEIHPQKYHLGDKMSVIGHSRGGGHAVWAPKYVANNRHLFPDDIEVRSVIALAPNAIENGNPDAEFLTDQDVPAYLVMYGSEDEDTAVNTRFNSGFISYDRSGYDKNENSYWGQSRKFYKSSVYLKGANHLSFMDTSVYNDKIKGYALAFLRWTLITTGDNRKENIIYFRDQVPITHTGKHNNLSIQYSHGPHRRVLENFEDNNSSMNTLFGNNYTNNVETTYGVSNAFFEGSPHETKVASIKWPANSSGTPYMRFKIPYSWWTYNYRYYQVRDISDFSHLTFRVGQNNRFNGGELDFYVVLRSYDYWTYGYKEDRIKVTDVGVIPGRYAVKDLDIRSVMNTISIPLCKFDNTDLTYVYDVTFEFDVPGHESGHVQIDSLEFTSD